MPDEKNGDEKETSVVIPRKKSLMRRSVFVVVKGIDSGRDKVYERCLKE